MIKIKKTKWVVAKILFFAYPAVYAAASAAVAVQMPLNFGIYNPFAIIDLDTIGRVAVNCSGDGSIAYSIALGAGNAGSYIPRRMAGERASLNYNLYTDATRTAVWGDGTHGTAIIRANESCSANSQEYIIYGRIPALQTTTPIGNYQDTVIVTFSY